MKKIHTQLLKEHSSPLANISEEFAEKQHLLFQPTLCHIQNTVINKIFNCLKILNLYYKTQERMYQFNDKIVPIFAQKLCKIMLKIE
jgi:hypothetical protein